METQEKHCLACNRPFLIRQQEIRIYQQLGLPLPTLCPEERLRRRLMWRNERKLYYRTCAASRKRIISVYSQDKPLVIYNKDYWWSDAWDARSYARDFDFSCSFFEQFSALQRSVPKMNMILSHCENCEYAPYSVGCRNCYMAVSCLDSEDVHYSYQARRSRDCIDCALCTECELCYECINCSNCFDLKYSKYCNNCSNCCFVRNCIGCSNCFCCTNLHNKQYYLFNQSLGKKEYESKVKELNTASAASLEHLKGQFAEFSLKQLHRFAYETLTENCVGDNIHGCKHCFWCFDSEDMEDCAYIYVGPSKCKDCLDLSYSPSAELVVDCLSAVHGYAVCFALHSWDIKNSYYVDECFYSQNLFGCVGLRHAEYCILNKQYRPAEFIKLKEQIITHMKKTGEWGEFFPGQNSYFAYNESMAGQRFPLSKEEILKQGLRYHEDDPLEAQSATLRLKDLVAEEEESITEGLLACSKCLRNYKIQKPEFIFYKKLNIPLPRQCPLCRYLEREKQRSPWTLYQRHCRNCSKVVFSPLIEEQYKDILCAKCYQDMLE